MKKFQYCENKTLKLTNVLKRNIFSEQENVDINILIEQMQSYIRIKGAIQIGPLIEYHKIVMTDIGDANVEIILMLQCDKYIPEISAPYTMDSVIRVPNAVYCRYHGSENFLYLAYQKIHVEAYESEIVLENENYTVFVDANDENITADVFIPRKK